MVTGRGTILWAGKQESRARELAFLDIIKIIYRDHTETTQRPITAKISDPDNSKNCSGYTNEVQIMASDMFKLVQYGSCLFVIVCNKYS